MSDLPSQSNPVQEKRTFCRVCEPACGLIAEVQDNELIRLRPDKEHPISKGFVCNKGIYGADMHNDPDRLQYPQKRLADGTLQRISWDQALAEISTKLNAVLSDQGPSAFASYAGNPSSFNTLFGPSFGGFIRATGASKFFSSGTQDCANKFAGAQAVYGTRTFHPIPDIDHSDCILLIGENPQVSHMSFMSVPHPMAHLNAAFDRGADVIYVNPRRVESVQKAGTLVQIKPDTDVYLLAALIHEIDQTFGFDKAATQHYGANVDELRAFVAAYSPAHVASVVGIDEADIKALAKRFAQASSACAHMSTGVNMGRQGTLAYWLLQMLVFVTGNLGKRGGNFFGAGFYSRSPMAGMGVPTTVEETKFGALRKPGGVGIALPAVLMADYLLDPAEPVRAMFVCSGNPLLSVAGEERMHEAFAQLELLVCVDIYPNATSEYADYLLPAAGAFEREDINLTGLGMQYQPSVQFTEAVVNPGYERKPDWWIFEKLNQAMGYPSAFDSVTPGSEPDMWGRVNAMLRSKDHSITELREAQIIPLTPAEPADFFSDHLPGDETQVQCFPAEFSDALDRMADIFVELESEPPGQLKLITKRDGYMFNSWFGNLEKLRPAHRSTNHLFIHPEDAAVRQINDGDDVQISNSYGEVNVAVKFSDDLRPGVVAMPHGWGHGNAKGMRVAQENAGVNCNRLLPSGPGAFEPLSNQAHMTGIAVEVRVAKA